MHTSSPISRFARRGITLLEVLIAIGILAVGLGSIVALIPAGRAQAGRAVVADRAAGLAGNVLADVVTYGLLRPECLTPYPPNPPTNFVWIDPSLVRMVTLPQPVGGGATVTISLSSARGLQQGMRVRWWSGAGAGALDDGTVQSVDEAANAVQVALASPSAPSPVVGQPIWFAPSFASPAFAKPAGIFAAQIDAAAFPPAVQLQTAMQGRDDVVVTVVNDIPDDPPANAVQDGARSFEGRMSAVACLRPFPNQSLSTLTVVTFHRRDPALPTLVGTLQSGTLTIPSWQAAALASRPVPDVIKPGNVVFGLNGFHKVTAARIDTITPVSTGVTGTYRAWMTFSTGTDVPNSAAPVPLTFLPDSVGLAERPVAPETTGPYMQ